jgi:hypothetical protein
VQDELERAVRGLIAGLHVRRRPGEAVVADASGADDERAQAMGEVAIIARVLRREPLVVVVARLQNDVGAMVVERLNPGLTLSSRMWLAVGRVQYGSCQ